MFWYAFLFLPDLRLLMRAARFFHFREDQDPPVPEAKTVFCAPTILPFSVTAIAHLEDGRLDSCAMSGDFNQDNNVTGPPNNGNAYNG